MRQIKMNLNKIYITVVLRNIINSTAFKIELIRQLYLKWALKVMHEIIHIMIVLYYKKWKQHWKNSYLTKLYRKINHSNL